MWFVRSARSILFATAAVLAFASPGDGAVKVYSATPPGGTPGDEILFTTSLSTPAQPSPGRVEGHYRLEDTGGSAVAIRAWEQVRTLRVDLGPADLVPLFGPGAFAFVSGDATFAPTLGQTGVGSVAPGGGVAWGVLGGWTRTGSVFCVASPAVFCTSGVAVPNGVTTAWAPAPSSTYDLGTWSFDANGDFEAMTGYIYRTAFGGLSNEQFLLRGTLVGDGVPALPGVALLSLVAGLLAAGARRVVRRRDGAAGLDR